MVFLALTVVNLSLLIVVITELGLAVIRHHLIIILVILDLMVRTIKRLTIVPSVVGSIRVFVVRLLVNTMFFMVIFLLRRMEASLVTTFLSKI